MKKIFFAAALAVAATTAFAFSASTPGSATSLAEAGSTDCCLSSVCEWFCDAGADCCTDVACCALPCCESGE